MTCTTDPSNQVAVVIVRGDTMRLSVALTDVYGAPVDVTGWSWLCQLRPTPDDPSSVAIVVTVTDAPGGLLALSLDPAITAVLPPGDYVFDLEATDTTPDTRTLVDGQLRVREDTSR